MQATAVKELRGREAATDWPENGETGPPEGLNHGPAQWPRYGQQKMVDYVNDLCNYNCMDNEGTAAGPPGFEHSGDESHILREVYRTNQAMFNNISRIMGVSASRLALLRLLAVEMPGGGGIMAIARNLGVNAAAVTRLVKELEEQKWVKRRSDPADARRTHVRLTAKGLRRVREIHRRVHVFERFLEERLGAEDVRAAVRVLSGIRAALDAFKDEGPFPPAGLPAASDR